jgi:hypothetical protein
MRCKRASFKGSFQLKEVFSYQLSVFSYQLKEVFKYQFSVIAIQKSFGRLEAGPTVEPASSRREKTILDKYISIKTDIR